MHDFQGYFSRTFQVLEFSRKNPGLCRRHGSPAYTSPTHHIPISTRLRVQISQYASGR